MGLGAGFLISGQRYEMQMPGAAETAGALGLGQPAQAAESVNGIPGGGADAQTMGFVPGGVAGMPNMAGAGGLGGVPAGLCFAMPGGGWISGTNGSGLRVVLNAGGSGGNTFLNDPKDNEDITLEELVEIMMIIKGLSWAKDHRHWNQRYWDIVRKITQKLQVAFGLDDRQTVTTEKAATFWNTARTWSMADIDAVEVPEA